MKLSQLHQSPIAEGWQKQLRNIALGGVLGTGLGYGIGHATKPKPKAAPAQQIPQQAPQALQTQPKRRPQVSIDQLAPFVTEYEGKRNKVYLDSRKIKTIGIGFNLERPGARQLLNSLGYNYNDIITGRATMSDQDIETVFHSDLTNARNDANRLVSNFRDLPQQAQMVIVDMAFNLGPTKFRGFEKTIEAFENNDFTTAAKEMIDSDWYHQVGNRSKRNVRIIKSLAQ